MALSTETLIQFFGWASVINLVLLSVSVIAIILWRHPICRLHQQLFKISETELMPIYFKFLAQYKLLIILLNLVPYFTLKLME